MIDRLVTDLPEPDSPTTASVSPAFSVNETSSTALTTPGIGGEMGLQMPDLQQRSASVRLRGHAHIAFRSLGSSKSRKPSPTICSDSAERMIATPGNTTSQIA